MSCEKVSCTVEPFTDACVNRLSAIKARGNEACLEAAKHGCTMDTSPLPDFEYGITHVCFVGSTNVGKSSALNGTLVNDADAPFCSTNIKAETVRCTEFSFCNEFSVQGQKVEHPRDFFEKLKTLQKRSRGSAEDDSSQVTDICVTIPSAPLVFDGGALAKVIDTPGVTEDATIQTAVLNRLKACPHGDLPVLVYCMSLGSGISERPGMELSTQDKSFIDASGVPPHRIVLVGTQYDRFVEEQKNDDDDDGGNERPLVSASTPAQYIELTDLLMPSSDLSDEEKRSKAEKEFASWKSKIENRYPGITVMPYARIGKKYSTTTVPPALRKNYAHQLRLAIRRCVTMAHQDMLLQYSHELAATITRRVSVAVTGSQELPEQYSSLVEDAVRQSQEMLQSLETDVTHIIDQQKTLLIAESNRPYVREKSFFNALLDRVYDRVSTHIRQRYANAQRTAHAEMQNKLDHIAAHLQVVEDGQAMSKAEDCALDAFDIGGLGSLTGGFAVGVATGNSTLVLDFAIGARLLASVSAGTGAAIALFLVGSLAVAAVESTRWSYDDVAIQISATYEPSIREQRKVFLEQLRKSLAHGAQRAVQDMNALQGDATSQAFSPVRAMLEDGDLQDMLRKHLSERLQCCICFENPSNIKLQPCGHDNFCSSCIAGLPRRQCPLCRCDIAQSMQI